MVRYRRNFVAGGTFFFTVTLVDRTSRALVDHVEALRAAMASTRLQHPFTIDAVVILPNHLHMVMTLPEGDAYYPNRWRLIKRPFHGRRHEVAGSDRASQKWRAGALVASILRAHHSG